VEGLAAPLRLVLEGAEAAELTAELTAGTLPAPLARLLERVRTEVSP